MDTNQQRSLHAFVIMINCHTIVSKSNLIELKIKKIDLWVKKKDETHYVETKDQFPHPINV